MDKTFKPQNAIFCVKIYLDANIYVNYLLGQKGEELAAEAFRRCIGCSFSIVSSPTVFDEVIVACKGNTLLLQNLADSLKKAGKLEILEEGTELHWKAADLNEKSRKKYGLNDFIHALHTRDNADLFVTGDLKFRPEAAKIAKTATLREFLASL